MGFILQSPLVGDNHQLDAAGVKHIPYSACHYYEVLWVPKSNHLFRKNGVSVESCGSL